MKLLPKDQIKIEPSYDGIHVIASLYEHEGYRHWIKYHLTDLPNGLISLNDMKRFGIKRSGKLASIMKYASAMYFNGENGTVEKIQSDNSQIARMEKKGFRNRLKTTFLFGTRKIEQNQ